MKRPSARSRRDQQHRCSACHAIDHRLETCTPAAAGVIKTLKKKLRRAQGTSKRPEPRHKELRSHAPKTGDYRSNATKSYSGSAASSGKWTHARRKKPDPLDWSSTESDELSVRWLLNRVFVSRPKDCPGCHDAAMDGPRQKAFLALEMQSMVVPTPGSFLSCSHWKGLQCAPHELVALLLHYSCARLSRPLRIEDMIQTSGHGYSTVMALHRFLQSCKTVWGSGNGRNIRGTIPRAPDQCPPGGLDLSGRAQVR